MGAVRDVRQDLPESFVRSVQQVEDDTFCRAYLSVYKLTKMILKYQSEAKSTN